jgi:hypothetical protein
MRRVQTSGRGMHTMRMHRLAPVQWQREFWSAYEYGMRGLWCGESDAYGEQMHEYKRHRYMIRNRRRLHARMLALYARVSACYFILSWRFMYLRLSLSEDDRTSIVRSRVARMSVEHRIAV